MNTKGFSLRDQLDQIARLDKAATQGEWRCKESESGFFTIYAAPFEDADFVASEMSPEVVKGLGLDYQPNAAFIVALVNWYRSGGVK